jgi:3-oxoacyl-[acyl-carrier protein] reductase
MKLQNKVAVVTGSSRGIGAHIAKALAAEGAKVVVNYVVNKAAADQVVSEIQGAGGVAYSIKADVSKSDEVKALFDTAIAHFGKVDILINNAGIAIFKKLQDTTEDEFERSLDSSFRNVGRYFKYISIYIGGKIT